MSSSTKVTITLLSSIPLPLTAWMGRSFRTTIWSCSRILRGAPNRLSGPRVVQDNLKVGLHRIGQTVRVNPCRSHVTPWVGVLSDPEGALAWAIKAKKDGYINRLIAGPNLVISPDQVNSIITHPAIDVVITPSIWVADFYKKVKPELSNRIVVWPAGVNEEYWSPALEQDKKLFDFLIYNKIQKSNYLYLVNWFKDYLQHLGFKTFILNYGSYSPTEYRRLLRSTNAILFLSESESQGLALFEAWSCNIPSLVWDRGIWEYEGYWANGSSAPYLTESCGISFSDLANFPKILDKFLDNISSYTPRMYILNHFNLTKAAQAYIKLFL